MPCPYLLLRIYGVFAADGGVGVGLRLIPTDRIRLATLLRMNRAAAERVIARPQRADRRSRRYSGSVSQILPYVS